jgi:hypothetical protein
LTPTIEEPIYSEFGEIVAYQTIPNTYDGFSGSAFYTGSSGTLVIASRGTDGWNSNDNYQNIFGAGVVQSGVTHPQTQSAQQFTADMISQVPPGTKIIFTGHF